MDDGGEGKRVLADCEASPDAAVRACIERLRHRRDDIADALEGQSLRVSLDLGAPLLTYRITFTREGHVMTRSGPEFHPHLEIHGPPREVGRLLFGDMSMVDASFEGLVTLHITSTEAAEYRRLRALVAEELADGRVHAAPGGT